MTTTRTQKLVGGAAAAVAAITFGAFFVLPSDPAPRVKTDISEQPVVDAEPEPTTTTTVVPVPVPQEAAPHSGPTTDQPTPESVFGGPVAPAPGATTDVTQPPPEIPNDPTPPPPPPEVPPTP